MKKARQVEAPPMDTDDDEEDEEAEGLPLAPHGGGGVGRAGEDAGQSAAGRAGVGDCDLITLEIEGGDQTLHDGKGQYSLIGLDTDTPYLQLAGRTYQGTYEYVMGTHLYFDDDDRDAGEGMEPQVRARFYGASTKKIVFRPVVLVPRDAPQGARTAE